MMKHFSLFFPILLFANKMRYSFATLALLACFLVSGCGFVHDENITGPYRLIAVDVDDQMSVCYDLEGKSAVGRINETVFAYGFDQRYIVAMQHPNNNRRVTNYFYLDMSKDSRYADPSVSVSGPFSKAEFEAVSQQLNLPKITRIIDHLK